jgi:phage major head subunit gpT-like protein
MIINQGALTALYTGFKTHFQQGLGMQEAMYQPYVTEVPSTTKEEEYGWLGKLPNMREWVGDRVLHGLALHGYSIRNKSFEMTVEVDKDDIDDDRLGVYAPMFQAMGEASAAHPNQMVFGALKDGFTAKGYDGQYFFDSDHPVIGADGVTESQSNVQAGAGAPWYLLSLSRALKPIILQKRKNYDFQAMTSPDSERVFMRKSFVYGVDARLNVGYSLWQLAFGSKDTLNATNFNAAYNAMMGRTGDHGRPLGVVPTHLVVPPSLREEAAEIVTAERLASGATNVNKGLVQVAVVPWLA